MASGGHGRIGRGDPGKLSVGYTSLILGRNCQAEADGGTLANVGSCVWLDMPRYAAQGGRGMGPVHPVEVASQARGEVLTPEEAKV